MLRTAFACSSLAALALVSAGCFGTAQARDASPTSLGPEQGSSQKAARVKPAFERPLLIARSGGYFSWVAPKGWKSSETSNGVDLASPDGKMGASSAVLIGSIGESNPWRFLSWALEAAGYRQIERVSAENLPSQPSGYPGISYEVKAFVIKYLDPSGSERQAEVTVGICNAYGTYSAAFQMYFAAPGEFKNAKTWLPMLTDCVRPLDASRLGNRNTVLLPRNHPLDDSSIMGAWQARQESMDRIDQARHETTMGYERMVSSDGTYYNMPFERYDAKLGGYKDPADSQQIMKHAPPGE